MSDCFGDNQSLACYMLPFAAAAVVSPVDGPGDNAARATWREQRWQQLRELYDIPDSARMRSIYDIELLDSSLSPNSRVWLGTKDASGIFDFDGNLVPFQGGFSGEEAQRKACLLRMGVTSEDNFLLANYYGLPPGKILGGLTGEDAAWNFGGAMGLENMIDDTVANGGEILFALHENIGHTKYTLQELHYILVGHLS